MSHDVSEINIICHVEETFQIVHSQMFDATMSYLQRFLVILVSMLTSHSDNHDLEFD